MKKVFLWREPNAELSRGAERARVTTIGNLTNLTLQFKTFLQIGTRQKN